jgi:aminocarboxymuconate-semialdehyde decarboxylase
VSTVDIHSHAIPPSVIEAIEADPAGFSARIEGKGKERHVVHDQGYAYPLFEEFVDPATKLQAMDGKGLDISVLSPPPPLFYYWADAKTGAHIARLVNDGIGELVSTKPARFRGTASVPMQDTEAAIAELERVVSAYGFRVVEVGTSIEGAQLADVAFRPLLERASELGVLILAHPYYVGAKQGLEDYYLTNLLENPYDSTLTIANLMFSGLLEELPSLKLCVAHGGIRALPDRPTGARAPGAARNAGEHANGVVGVVARAVLRHPHLQSSGASLPRGTRRGGADRPRLRRPLRHG